MSKYTARYQGRLLQGLCGRCGQLPIAERSKYSCDACLQHHYKNKERVKAKDKRFRVNRRYAVLVKYGGHCVCCGLDNLDYLEIDHIYGQHGIPADKKDRGMGGKWHKSLIETPVRDDLQLLCSNCHLIKSKGLQCPLPHPWTVINSGPPQV